MFDVRTADAPSLLLVTDPDDSLISVIHPLARAAVPISPSPTLSAVIQSSARAAVATTPAAKNEDESIAPDAMAEDVTAPEERADDPTAPEAIFDDVMADDAILAAMTALSDS